MTGGVFPSGTMALGAIDDDEITGMPVGVVVTVAMSVPVNFMLVLLRRIIMTVAAPAAFRQPKSSLFLLLIS